MTNIISGNELKEGSYKPYKKEGVFNPETNNITENTIPKSEYWLSIDSRNYTVESKSLISVYDVAEYILRKLGELTTMKLHKLLYYCQAWSLVWDEKPLFPEEIEAWANGPVVKDLFSYHRGQYSVSNISIGNPNLIHGNEKVTIDSVLDYYGNKSAQWLIELTHMEDPWKMARKGLEPTERGKNVITYDLMSDYYSAL